MIDMERTTHLLEMVALELRALGVQDYEAEEHAREIEDLIDVLARMDDDRDTIIRNLAKDEPINWDGSDMSMTCHVCGAVKYVSRNDKVAEVPHAPDCAWRLAREMVGREIEPSPEPPEHVYTKRTVNVCQRCGITQSMARIPCITS